MSRPRIVTLQVRVIINVDMINFQFGTESVRVPTVADVCGCVVAGCCCASCLVNVDVGYSVPQHRRAIRLPGRTRTRTMSEIADWLISKEQRGSGRLVHSVCPLSRI